MKKEDLSWQVLDYDEYEECQNKEDPSKTNVYALFPFGSPYTRAYYMQDALEQGRFDDGGFVEGHRGADWHSRALSAEILAKGTDGTADPSSIYEMIYDYEVKIRTARKILNTSMDLSTKLSFAEGFLIDGVADETVESFKALAEKEVQEELREYSVRSPIVSVAAGIVTGAEYNCYSGFFAAVRHTVTKTPVRTSYVHMRRWPTVQEGDIVGPGTVVGYEGTTGNSTGYHLHQNMDNDGNDNGTIGDSPAEYMAPIFTPFYNRDKVFETLGTIKNEWNGKQELIMGTEYMELIRTVLMYPMTEDGTFDFDETWYFDKDATMNTGDETLTFLLSCTTIRSGDEEYLNYSSGDNNEGDLDDFYDGRKTVVIKEGSIANPKYYKCEVEAVIVPVTVDDDGEAKVIQEKRLKILPGTKEEFNFEQKSLRGVEITVDIGAKNTKEIFWGNNTPLTPLVDDISKLIDVTVMNTLKKFDPWSERFSGEVTSQANNPPKNENPDQVTANPDVFTPDESRLALPKWALLHVTDVESPYAVPFYDGPISIEMANNAASQYSYSTAYDTGYAGSLSGDLISLKKAIKARGLIAGDEIDVESAEYDEAFANLWKRVANTPGYEDLASLSYAQNGNLGTYGAGDDNNQSGQHFSNWGVCIWNTIVTYGSVADAQKAGEAAAEMGATQLGVRPSWIVAVAKHESSLVPTAESHNFCDGRQDISFITNASYPTEQPTLSAANAVIEYKGVERTLRRAVGLMQLAPPYCLAWASESGITDIDQMIAAIKSPKSNAMLGAMQLRGHMNDIINDSSRYNKLKANVDSNMATFEALCKDTGISPYEMALMGCATLCYNRGYSVVDDVIDGMATIQYDSSSKTITGGKDLGYYRSVMCKIAEAERSK